MVKFVKAKKFLAVILAGIAILSVLPNLTFTASAAGYDSSAAISYARNHWNDGNGACATFVSNCLQAGGCTAWSSGVGTLKDDLLNGGWGTLYELKRDANNYYSIKASDNAGKLSQGDPIFFYCKKCSKPWAHVMICSGFDSSGYAKAYAHNVAKNDARIYNYTDGSHSGSDIVAYSIHMQSHTHNYVQGYEAAHPHKIYMKCSCGDWYYTGETTTLDNCELCHPLRIIATDETKLTGFIWNNMDNANSYDLRVWKTADNANIFTVYGIKNTDYSHSLPGGNYYAELCVGYKNGVIEYFDRVNFTVKGVGNDFQPTGTAIFGNKIFALFENSVSYDYAKTACEKMGGHLASIHNQQEQEVIESLIVNKNVAFWLGGNDSETEGVWKWEDGTAWDYDNWAPDEPNNDDTYYGHEDYLEISSYTGFWNDVPHRYNFNYGFIAEFYIDEIAKSQSTSTIRYEYHKYNVPVSKYILFNKAVPWEVAEAYCESLGGHLATITSPEENVAISTLLGNKNYYIGGTDKNVEGNWQWVNNEVFDYTYWRDGQPDNHIEEDYVMVYGNNQAGDKGIWNDISNHYASCGFVCEIDIAYQSPEAPQIVVGCKKVRPGGTVDVTVSLKNNPGIASLKLKVDFDSDLTLTGVAYNDSTGGNYQQPQTMKSPVILNWYNGAANSNGDFVFATLTFNVNDNAQIGNKPITVTYDPDDVYNIDENNIVFAVVNGNIDVVNYMPGDINGDDKVNNKDLTRLFQHLSNCDVTVNEAALDINGDGKVNNKDLTRLFQYLSSWNVEIF